MSDFFETSNFNYLEPYIVWDLNKLPDKATIKRQLSTFTLLLEMKVKMTGKYFQLFVTIVININMLFLKTRIFI